MNFKIKHNKLTIKRLIISSLIASMLTSNLNLSYADTFLDNERYELFQGNKLSIESILEEDKVNLELEGNTLINLIDSNSRNVRLHTKRQGTNTDGSIYYYHKNDATLKFPLKSNTTYTLSFKVTDNKYDHVPIHNIVLGQGDKNMGHGTDTWSYRLYWDKDFNMKEGEKGLGYYQTTFTTSSRIAETSYLWIGFLGQLGIDFDTMIEDIVLVEGEHDIENYFEGMKSVGELDDGNHSLTIDIANKKNLFDKNNVRKEFIEWDTGAIKDSVSGLNRTTDWIKCKPNTQYTVTGAERNRWLLKNSNGEVTFVGSEVGNETPTITTNSDTVAFKCYVIYRDISLIDNIKIFESSNYKTNNYKLSLSEPLRGISDTVRDRIIKKNGQWVIERNCKEVILNGDESEEWYTNRDFDGSNTMFVYLNKSDAYLDPAVLNVKSNLFNGYDTRYRLNNQSNNREGIYVGDNANGLIQVHILKSKLDTQDLNGLKKYLSNNPLEVVYRLRDPIYEPLNIDSAIELFESSTHVSIDSVIPANLKVTVDRVLNRALDAIEAAKSNPTANNISIARMWTNLAKESIKKDALQNELNNIIEIADLSIDKKKVTANMDLYIRSENTLSMSLDTNSVTFSEYSGLEEMEKLKAVNISISSSLPYDLNAYMPVPISNSDGTNIMEMGLFNIKENTESIYRTFVDTTTKVPLKLDCQAGNNKLHSIDLKLDSDSTHKADVYKATIKFEAQQK